MRAQKIRTLIKQDFEKVYAEGVHAILTPATPTAAFGIGEKGSGDPVAAENYYQHAEHYFRVLRTLQPQRPASEIVGRDSFSGLDLDFDEDGEGQTDEADLGISYARADEILNGLLHGFTPEALEARGFSHDEVALVRRRLDGTHWKRRPPAVALVSHSGIGESYLRPVDY